MLIKEKENGEIREENQPKNRSRDQDRDGDQERVWEKLQEWGVLKRGKKAVARERR